MTHTAPPAVAGRRSDYGRRRTGTTAMVMVACVLAALFVAANLPAPLYVIYRDRFHFSEITLTLAYAVYMAGSLAAMVFVGRLSDQVGRRPVVVLAVAATILTMLIFVFTTGTWMLFVGRLLSGFAIGIAAAACTAWIAELHPGGDKVRAALTSVSANVAGLGIGPLVAGVLAQYTSWPLRLPYLVFIAAMLPIAAASWMARETVGNRKPWREVSLRPRLGVPREIASQFISPAVTTFVSFALMGFYSGVAPTLLGQTLHITSHAVAGAVVFLFFGVGVATLWATQRLDSRTAMLAGVALIIPPVLALLAAQALASLTLLLVATILGGISVALGYRGSLQVINLIAPGDRRAELVATYFLSCYVGVSIPVVGIGGLAQMASLTLAAAVFAGLLCLLAGAALVTGIKYPPET